MTSLSRRKLLASAALAAAFPPARAQTSAWPDRPPRLIVGFAAGGGSDFVARAPEAVVEENRERVNAARAEVVRLKAALARVAG